MKIQVVVVGRVRGALESAVAEYEERARRYWKVEVAEVAGGAAGKSPSGERVMAAEAERILARVSPELDLVALTRTGEGMGSRRLADWLGERGVASSPGVAFVVGGAFGLADSVLARATHRLSLSSMTFPHEVARLVLAEQLYRAGTILRGEPYHKGA